jgi:hypothetical protein
VATNLNFNCGPPLFGLPGVWGASNRLNTMPSRFSRRSRCHSSVFWRVVNAVST